MELTSQEFRQRVQKIRERMTERGLDALIIYADMRAAGGGNAFYVSNSYPTSQGFDAVVLPNKGDLCLITRPGLLGGSLRHARSKSWIKGVKGEPYGMWGVDYARHAREALEERHLADARIGMVGTEFMSKDLYERFLLELPHAKLEEAAGLVEGVRAVKSQREIESITEACRLTDIGMEAFRRAVKPGGKHAEAVADAEYKAKLAGAGPCVVPTASGMPWVWCWPPINRRFHEGDMVTVEMSPTFNGYWGQVCRSWVVGKASGEQKRVYNTVLEAAERMGEMVRPGVSGEDLWQAGMKVIGRAGYEFGGLRFGHGMGLSMAEGFDLMPGEKSVLEAGNYVVVHPCVFLPETGNGAMIGDAFLVTETGCRRLTKARKRLEAE